MSAVESTPAVAFKKPEREVAMVPSDGALVSVPIVEVALMRASARESVKYLLVLPCARASVVVAARSAAKNCVE
jgi:hypothetical protein